MNNNEQFYETPLGPMGYTGMFSSPGVLLPGMDYHTLKCIVASEELRRSKNNIVITT